MQSDFLFGIGIGFASISGMPPASSGMKRLDRLGVDILIGEVLGGRGMLGMRGFILGPFTAAFVTLRAFILESDFDASAKDFRGSPSASRAHHFMTNLEQNITVASFTIGD